MVTGYSFIIILFQNSPFFYYPQRLFIHSFPRTPWALSVFGTSQLCVIAMVTHRHWDGAKMESGRVTMWQGNTCNPKLGLRGRKGWCRKLWLILCSLLLATITTTACCVILQNILFFQVCLHDASVFVFCIGVLESPGNFSLWLFLILRQQHINMILNWWFKSPLQKRTHYFCLGS